MKCTNILWKSFTTHKWWTLKKKHLVKNQYFAMYTYISIEWVFLLFFSFLSVYISYVGLGLCTSGGVPDMSFPCVCRRLFDKSVYYYLGLRWVATRLWWLCSESNIICFFARETLAPRIRRPLSTYHQLCHTRTSLRTIQSHKWKHAPPPRTRAHSLKKLLTHVVSVSHRVGDGMEYM